MLPSKLHAHPPRPSMADPNLQAEVLTASVRVNGTEAEATLRGGELTWRPADTGGGGEGQERGLELESEVLGCRVDGRKLKLATFTASGGGDGKGGGGDGNRRREEVVVEMETEDAALRWGDIIRDCLASLGRPKKLFIIVNPYGGKRSGRSIFQNEVLPLIEASGVLYTMQETKHRLHAQEIARSLDLRKYDGIICVSGDGVMVEVVNGLLQREDWETAIKVPLGIVPAGHKRALDVTSVVQGNTRFFSVLMLTWGLVADVDIESEKYRWMGSARLEFYKLTLCSAMCNTTSFQLLLRMLNLRRYNGRILFVPAPGYEEVGDPVEQTTGHETNGVSGATDKNGETCGYVGPSIKEADLRWRSLNGPFVSVWLGNVPFASEDAMAAPKAEFADGYLDAAIIKDCPRWDVLGLVLQMKDGAYVNSPCVEYFKVKAIRIEPGLRVGSSTKGGIIDSDGEVLARGDGSHSRAGDEPGHLMAYGPPIQLTVDQGLATIFSPR
ncbi:Sphingosine kinase 1 [Zea mays]|uniref:Sphingosine kinase 1 n=1 Tax=Zea mays TaxID=4577 RepID=A0A1D6IFL6_MAIZE|nr:Sphingosine kinase 1 [Zea mays]